MMKLKFLKIVICIVLIILLIIFTPKIFTTFPVLKNLFNDNINYILIMLLVIFIMLIDIWCGCALALVILYMSLYINNNNTIIKKNMMIPMKTLPDFIKIEPTNNNIINNKVDTNMNSNTTDNTHAISTVQAIAQPTVQPTVQADTHAYDNTNVNTNSNSEFIYDNTKPFPNNNLKPFQPKESVSSQDNINQNNINFVQQTINQECSNDSITNVGEPDRSGFDVSGCRYDMKNSPQNLTQYGPPVSKCSAYDPSKIQTCGTLFYPLNA
jgi:hypothetical protein